MFIIFFLYDIYMKNNGPAVGMLFCILILSTALFVVLTRDLALVVLCAVITTLMSVWVISRRKKYALSILSIITGYILSKIFFVYVLHYNASQETVIFGRVPQLFGLVGEFFGTMALSLASGLFPIYYLQNDFGMPVTLVISCIITIAHFVAVFYYFRLEMWKESLLPLMLILFGLWFYFSSVFFRYLTTTIRGWMFVSPRYYHIYSFNILGMFWIFAKTLNMQGYKKATVSIVILMLIAAMEVGNINRGWKQNQEMNKARDITSVMLYTQGIGHDRWENLWRFLFPYDVNLTPQVEFLVKHKLSLFNENLMPDSVTNYTRSNSRNLHNEFTLPSLPHIEPVR